MTDRVAKQVDVARAIACGLSFLIICSCESTPPTPSQVQITRNDNLSVFLNNVLESGKRDLDAEVASQVSAQGQ